MATMEERLSARLEPLGARAQKMFGGVCFMLNGNMAVGTSKRGVLLRIGADAVAAAAKSGRGRPMTMGDRVMAGYCYLDEEALQDAAEFERWIGLVLAFNKTLPPKAAKAKRR